MLYRHNMCIDILVFVEAKVQAEAVNLGGIFLTSVNPKNESLGTVITN